MTSRIVLLALFTFLAAAPSFAAEVAVGVWWWDSRQAEDAALAAPRLEFLASRKVTEIYLCARREAKNEDLVRFIREAKAKGMRVACLAGDVSWINPGNTGFDETLAWYRRYQKAAPEDARFYALHFDVEPHQNPKLSEARKWQLYADFALRAAAFVRRAGEKIEWDIPFWLDHFKVCRDERTDVPLLEVIMDCADGVVLMSYRDTAKAMLETGREEIALGKTRPCRVLLGAETGQTGEGDFVSYFEEGKAKMAAELEKVKSELATAELPAGTGVAVHHVGSWMKLKD